MTTNIFGGNVKPNEEFQEKVDTHTKTILSIIQRQKDLESNMQSIMEKLEMLDHNHIKTSKVTHVDIKSLREDIKEVKSELSSIKEFNDKISKQIRLMTTKDEVAKLEKYIDLWNPMEFVTRQELDNYSEKVKKELAKTIEEFLKKD